MKKNLKKALSVLLAALMVAGSTTGLIACGPGGGGGGGGHIGTEGDRFFEDREVDENKTQLYVFNFNGGYGSDWLMNLVKRFEKDYEETRFEEGKTGVQVIVDNNKTNATDYASSISSSDSWLFFTEYANYFTLMSEYDAFADITPAVNTPLVEYGETKSIVDKLNVQQKDYYNVGTDAQPKYYGVPHYAGYDGIIYNADTFDKYGWYLIDKSGSYYDAEDENTWFKGKPGGREENKVDPKSAGPDGEEGTDDDGLPRTYEEFYALIRRIQSDSCTPFVWNGTSTKTYTNFLMWALAANQMGAEQTMLNYTMNGTATSLGHIEGATVGADGKLQGGYFVYDTADTPISTTNGQMDLCRQDGKYYSLEFLNMMRSNPLYYYKDSFKGDFEHMNAQETFLYAGNDGVTEEIAMLVDGCWWESEAVVTFTDMENSKGAEWNKYGRNMRWMPLPKVSEADAANPEYTLVDSIYSLCFLNKKVESMASWVKDLCYTFIRYAHTDVSLREFTTTTNTVKAFEYNLTDDDEKLLTNFGKSLAQLKERATIVYPYDDNELYINKQSNFNAGNFYWTDQGGGTMYDYAITAFKDHGVSVNNYFQGMITYWNDNNGSKWTSIIEY